MSAPSLPRGPRLLVAALLTLLGACEPPPVYGTADPRQDPENATTRIEGTVVVTGKSRGNAVLFLYDATNPPPPQGTGRPLSFAVVSQQRLFGEAPAPDASGPFTTPFTFSRVRPGRYLLRGIIDRDGCAGSTDTQCRGPDFIPWFYATNEPNRLDVGGAAVDVTTLAPRVIQVDDVGRPVTGVAISFSDSATFPVDRPVFSVTGSGQFNPSAGNKFLDLNLLPIADRVVDQRQPAFLARYVDDNRDGKPDDANRDDVPDFWPKVVVRKLDTVNSSTNLVEETGTRYERADGTPPPATGSDVVVIGAAIVPQPIIAALTDPATGEPRRDANGAFATAPVSSLKIVLTNSAYDVSNPAAPVRLRGVPSGRYALIVLSLTGQTWRVPNELQPATANSFGEQFRFPAIESQGFVIEVP